MPKTEVLDLKEEKRYSALPGFKFAGLPRFPFSTDDPDIQNKIESSAAFKKSKRVWVDNSTDETRSALKVIEEKVSRGTLIKILEARGMRNLEGYTTLDLLEIVEKGE